MRVLKNAVLFYLATVTIADAATLRPLTPLVEVFSKNPPVSGSLLTGMRRGSATGKINLHDLIVALPAFAKGQLCLDLSTRDGSYTGRQTFEVASAPPATQPLALQSKYAETLLSYAAEDLSGLAEIRANCTSGQSGTFVPISLPGAEGSNILAVHVNTQNSAARIRLSDAGATFHLDAKCDLVSGGSNTTFDRVCTVFVPGESWSKVKKLTISMIGFTGGVTDESYDVSLGPVH